MNVIITPDKTLWSKPGNVKYTIPKAISEFIDNALDSTSYDKLNLSIHLETNGDYVGILDDADGMNEKEFTSCLTIANHKDKNNSIDIYGFGLKSASSYLGKKFVIYTKRANMTDYLKFEYYEDEFLKNKKWEIKIIKLSKDKLLEELNFSFEHGTYILITDLKVKLYKRLTMKSNSGILISKLEQIYKYKIKNNSLNLTIVSGLPNDITAKRTVVPYVDIDMIFKDTIKHKLQYKDTPILVEGSIGLKNPNKTPSLKDNGLTLYHNGRAILTNYMPGINHPEKRLIVGELNVIGLNTTLSKDDYVRNEQWHLFEESVNDLLIKPLQYISNTSNINRYKKYSNNINVKDDFDNIFKKELEKHNTISILNKETVCNQVIPNYINTKKINDDDNNFEHIKEKYSFKTTISRINIDNSISRLDSELFTWTYKDNILYIYNNEKYLKELNENIINTILKNNIVTAILEQKMITLSKLNSIDENTLLNIKNEIYNEINIYKLFKY